MRRSLSLRTRVAIASALSAAIVIAAIAIGAALFLRADGTAQVSRVLDAAVVTVPTEGTVPAGTPATLATPTEPALVQDVAVAGSPGSTLSLAVPEGPLADAIRHQQVLVILAAAAAIAVAAGLGWLLAGRAVRPLQRLAAATHTIGDEPGAARPTIRGAREAEELSDAISAMLDRIGSAQRRTEVALGAARDFAAVSAHELRTPLTSMRTDLEVLATLPLTDGQRAEILQELLAAQRRVEDTLAGLEQLAIGEMADAAEHGDIDLIELADRAVQESSRIHPDVDITLVGPDQAVIRAFPAGLRLVLENAIANAVRHGRARRIVVGVQQAGGGATLTVDDDGTGIPEAERTRVFEKFVRGANTEADGSGLGLALVAQQALLHGGAAELAESPLGGARLLLTLPSNPTTWPPPTSYRS